MTFAAALGEARGQLVINEILFNPPFGDLTNEFIELRGTPNHRIPDDTYLVGVEGDGDVGENPGTIQNVFDLSGLRLGQKWLSPRHLKGEMWQPWAPSSEMKSVIY